MKMRHRRVLFGVPFGALAAVAAFSAAAYACTLFYGTLTVQGNGGGSVTTTGLRNGMLQRVSKTFTYASANGGSVKISTGVDGCCNKLPAKSYNVNFNNFTYSNHKTWSIAVDCMTPGADGTVQLGTITVGSAGSIVAKDGVAATQPVQFSLPSRLTPNSGTGEAGVCLSDTFQNYGNFAPVTIV